METPQIKDALTEDVLRHVFQLADYLTHSQLRFAVGVGAHVTEIESLQWPDVDLDNRRVWLCGSGTVRGRFVTLPPNVLVMLWDMKAWTTDDPAGAVWIDRSGIAKIPLQTRWRRLFVLWANAHSQGLVAMRPPKPPPPLAAIRRFAIQLLLDCGAPTDEVAVWAGFTGGVFVERP